ncbi:amidohydrolase, partial [Candidatus Bathyarchaeota archaeon]|nr:amidohydrolase [Candidatus Bathyarchaeota archaeon]
MVPDYARSWYYIRSPEREQVNQLYEKVLKIAEGAALMTGTTHKVKFLSGSYNLLPNNTLSELVTANMREIGAPKHTKEELDFAKELSKSFDPEQKKE